MNIAIVSLQYGTTATGGGGVHVNRISEEYVKRGHKVTVLTMHTGTTEKEFKMSGQDYSSNRERSIRVIRFLIEKGIKTPYDGDKKEEFSRIKKFCERAAEKLGELQKEVKVVHLHGHHLVPGYLAHLLEPLEFKVVSTIHFLESTLRGKDGVDHINRMPEGLFNRLRQWEVMTTQADEIVVISPGQHEDFLNICREEEMDNIEDIKSRMHLISSGVESKAVLAENQIRDKWADSSRGLKVLSYSRLDPSKGLHYSIRSLPALVEVSGPGLKLVVAGIPSKDYDKVLKEEKDRLPEVIKCELNFFTEIFDCEERNNFMDNFAVYLFPTLSEPFGITLIETAARGMFIITTDSAGPMYIMGQGGVEEKEWGYISDYGINVKLTSNPETHLISNIAEAWKWFENNRDKALDKILNFRKLILEKYTWDAVVRQYFSMYNKTLE